MNALISSQLYRLAWLQLHFFAHIQLEITDEVFPMIYIKKYGINTLKCLTHAKVSYFL